MSSSLALLLRASSGRPAGCLSVISSLGTRPRSASRSAFVTSRTSAAPRLLRRKIFLRPRSGWKRRFFGSVRKKEERKKNETKRSRRVLLARRNFLSQRNDCATDVVVADVFEPWLYRWEVKTVEELDREKRNGITKFSLEIRNGSLFRFVPFSSFPFLSIKLRSRTTDK